MVKNILTLGFKNFHSPIIMKCVVYIKNQVNSVPITLC